MKTLLYLIGIVIIGSIIMGIIEGEPKTTATRSFESDDSRSMAKVMCEELVKQKLKSPSTAKFNSNPSIIYEGDSTYLLTSYVDSQNSFGAMIRMKFKARVKFTDIVGDQERWILLSFIEL